jgi:hypothetical protein
MGPLGYNIPGRYKRLYFQCKKTGEIEILQFFSHFFKFWFVRLILDISQSFLSNLCLPPTGKSDETFQNGKPKQKAAVKGEE